MFVMPETLDGLSANDLQALIDSGLDALRALGITEDTTDDELLAQGDEIVTALDTLGAAHATATTAEAAVAARSERARNLVTRATSAEAVPTAPDAPAADP